MNTFTAIWGTKVTGPTSTMLVQAKDSKGAREVAKRVLASINITEAVVYGVATGVVEVDL